MKRKNPPNPKGLVANLKPGRSGRPKHRFVLPVAWDTFCIQLKLTGKKGLAAARAGYHASYAPFLLKHPMVIARLKEIDEEMISRALAAAAKEYVLHADLLDDNLVKVIRSGSHARRGYADKVAAIKHGNELLGRIDSTKTTINNQANAAAAVGLTASRLYLPDWRKETIEKLQNDERSKTGLEIQAGE